MSEYVRLRLVGDIPERYGRGGWKPFSEGDDFVHMTSGSVTTSKGPGGRWTASRLDVHGRTVYSLPLSRRGLFKMGPNFGYRIKMPEEETDPFLRVAREFGVPVTKIGAPVHGTAEERILENALNFTRTDGAIFLDGRGGAYILNFTWLLETFEKLLRDGRKARFVSRIERTPGADPATLAAHLRAMELGHRPEWAVSA